MITKFFSSLLFKIIAYVLGLVIIIGGVFAGMRLQKLLSAESYINGSLNNMNQFVVENFNYSASNINFYDEFPNDEIPPTFEIDMPKVENFNGETLSYKITLNNYYLTETIFSAGAIYSIFYIDFNDTENETLQSCSMQIRIQYLNNRTNLKITTETQDEQAFLEQYFEDNGIRLKVIEVLKGE